MDKRVNVFLLIGQSNMAGRGLVEDVPPLRDEKVVMFRDESWVVAEEPLHTDIPAMAGIGLGMSFAMKLLSLNHPAPIGLVPCAFGGTRLHQWAPGEELYETAVATTRLALAEGTLCGILWHQGEGDSADPDLANTYATRFTDMITRLRNELSAEKVPVVTGELGTFWNEHPDGVHAAVVNQQLKGLEQSLAHYGCVSSEGLSDKGDKVHFNSEALRELGRRYASKYMSLRK